MVFPITLVLSASCALGMMIGSAYPETIRAGCSEISKAANKTWSTVRETTSGIYAKMTSKPQGKTE